VPPLLRLSEWSPSLISFSDRLPSTNQGASLLWRSCEKLKTLNPKMPPKVLLQDALTHNFFRGALAWTKSFEGAVDFVEVPCALDYALSHKMGRVRVVLKFSNRHNDLELPPLRSMASCPGFSAPTGCK
jgi:hypothetical protein